MISNYLKLAIRNLLKNKVFSIINIGGLAISTSVCLLIISIIADQKNYDQFHTKKDRIFRVLTNTGSSEMATSSFQLGDEIVSKHTGIEKTATLVRGFGGDIFYNEKIASGGGYFADRNLFEIFDYKLIEGDPNTALNAPRSLVISEALSKQLFYNENPVGKSVRFKNTGVNPIGVDHGNQETDYGLFTITGILDQNPGKTHLPFQVLTSLETIRALAKDSILNTDFNNWELVWECHNYALISENNSQVDLQVALDKISKEKFTNVPYSFKAQALGEITPGPMVGNTSHVFIPKMFLIFLAGLCLIIILSAGFNYTNLTLARSFTRAKEVGIRKVSGAKRGQVFYQFICESVVISLASFVLAIPLLFILQNIFSKFVINQYINITFEHNPSLYLIFIGFSILIGVLAGFFPSLYVSAFSPIQILKNVTNIKIFKKLSLQRGLLLVQFCFSLIFIISAVLVFRQTDYIFNYEYGFNKDNVINITLYNPDNYARFSQSISSFKDVSAIGAASLLPSAGRGTGMQIWKTEGGKDTVQTQYIDIDAKSLNVWDIDLVAGKNLPDIPEVNNEKYILINEKLSKDLKFETPNQAIGQRVVLSENNVEIVGVVKDFQSQSVTSEIKPLMLRNRQSEFRYATIKVSGQNNQDVLNRLETKWKEVNPTTKFEYKYFDQELQSVHTVFTNIAAILGFIAFLAVLISCLGLLGIAIYTSEIRRKEIGVRKILGSSIFEIIVLLSKSYIFLISAAMVIAVPIAYFVNNAWLNFFPSRININLISILISILFMVGISFLIVFSQSWRVAKSNPVDALKAE
ncbi:MAG: ABC transporter permease [Saprospiraceae bacterium]|nr:ABC transporter permease [Saprospiraceae bacterium]